MSCISRSSRLHTRRYGAACLAACLATLSFAANRAGAAAFAHGSPEGGEFFYNYPPFYSSGRTLGPDFRKEVFEGAGVVGFELSVAPEAVRVGGWAYKLGTVRAGRPRFRSQIDHVTILPSEGEVVGDPVTIYVHSKIYRDIGNAAFARNFVQVEGVKVFDRETACCNLLGWLRETQVIQANVGDSLRVSSFGEAGRNSRSDTLLQLSFSPTEPADPPIADLPPPTGPCPAATRPLIKLSKLDGPAGSHKLLVKGEISLAYPFDPPIDPIADGIRFKLLDDLQRQIVSVEIPPGEFDKGTKTGWKRNNAGTSYRWKSADGIDGIFKVVLRWGRAAAPGTIKYLVVGKNGDYSVDPDFLPLASQVRTDTDEQPNDQCAEQSFGQLECAATAKAVLCR